MTKTRNLKRRATDSLLLLTACAALCSCDHSEQPAYSHFVSVPSSGWNTLDGKEFHVYDDDSIPRRRYRMVIAVRHNASFPYSRLWLELEQADSRGVISTDTVPVEISTDGIFRGRGRYGLFEVLDTLPDPVTVTDGWQVSVRHISKDQSISGLNNIGLILLDY